MKFIISKTLKETLFILRQHTSVWFNYYVIFTEILIRTRSLTQYQQFFLSCTLYFRDFLPTNWFCSLTCNLLNKPGTCWQPQCATKSVWQLPHLFWCKNAVNIRALSEHVLQNNYIWWSIIYDAIIIYDAQPHFIEIAE